MRFYSPPLWLANGKKKRPGHPKIAGPFIGKAQRRLAGTSWSHPLWKRILPLAVLKIRWPQGREGLTPFSGTNSAPMRARHVIRNRTERPASSVRLRERACFFGGEGYRRNMGAELMKRHGKCAEQSCRWRGVRQEILSPKAAGYCEKCGNVLKVVRSAMVSLGRMRHITNFAKR